MSTVADASLAAGPVPDAAAMMPPLAPLDMPEQSLHSGRLHNRRLPTTPRGMGWRRLYLFGGAGLMTALACYLMLDVLMADGVSVLDVLLLVLYVALFGWIALAFFSAMAGFCVMLFGRHRRLGIDPHAPLPVLSTRTALLMPTYNEDPHRVLAGLEAIRESLLATGQGDRFDFFVLSDTTRPGIAAEELQAVAELRGRLSGPVGLYYRHRSDNTGRKAGNIGGWVREHGAAYPQFLILDADSLMTGECIVRLVAGVEAHPDVALVQSLPVVINGTTLFARMQQFGGRVYGPVIAHGVAWWHGAESNYWGHNAVIRTRAFAECAGLPTLRGGKPFGGHILSHDFVEAALIRRAGWSVYMLPEISGSYEESPPSLIDVAARDRRWCQGNLQHSRVIGAAGLKLATRQHFATGIISYLSSPFWLTQLLVGILLVLQTHYVRPEYFTRDFSLFPVWPRFDSERALALFALTMGILLAPKFLGFLLALLDRGMRRASGGGVLLFLSMLFEVLMSALLAPIMMVIQSGAVTQILAGRDTGWQPQRRDDGSIPFRDIVRRHRWHVLLGVATGISAFMIAPSLFAWMSPTILGLVLAIPISWASGKLAIGLALRRAGLLMIPEETSRPRIATRAQEIAEEFAALGYDDADSLAVLHEDAQARSWHESLLPPARTRRRGEFDTDRTLAQAKLVDAESLADVRAWLSPKERTVLYTDRALLDLLARLPTAREDEAGARDRKAA